MGMGDGLPASRLRETGGPGPISLNPDNLPGPKSILCTRTMLLKRDYTCSSVLILKAVLKSLSFYARLWHVSNQKLAPCNKLSKNQI